MDSALQAMLTETVLLATFQGQDAYGKPTYGPGVPTPARVAARVTTVTDAQGQERTSTSVVYLDGSITVSVSDRVVLPDGTAPAIQAIYSPTDPTQPGVVDHHEISL